VAPPGILLGVVVLGALEGLGVRLGALVVARGLAGHVDRAVGRNSSSEFIILADRSVCVVMGLSATSVGKMLPLVFAVLFISQIVGLNRVQGCRCRRGVSPAGSAAVEQNLRLLRHREVGDRLLAV
jgi:hypothetical protein